MAVGGGAAGGSIAEVKKETAPGKGAGEEWRWWRGAVAVPLADDACRSRAGGGVGRWGPTRVSRGWAWRVRGEGKRGWARRV
jgi:hypothetical protein